MDGSCDGGLDRRALEVTYPASTGAAKSRTQATARERGSCGMECHSSEQDARLTARSERLRATGPIWWLSSSRALSFHHYHERSVYAIAPPPIGRASLGCTPATSRPRQRPSVALLSHRVDSNALL